MAASANGDKDDAEIGQDLCSQVFSLGDFVKRCVLPECVSVTEGNFLSKSVQISKGDVILLKSIEGIQKVTVSFKPAAGLSRTEVTLSLDYPQKFYVLPPKEASAEHRAFSIVTYPTISDLLLDSPTHFEATASYDDPYLPGCSVKAGDRFRFEEVVLDSKDGVERLKVRDELGNSVMLASDCRGNFCPLKDDKQYTIKELIGLAPVQRRLTLTIGGESCDDFGDCQDEYSQVDKNRRSPTQLSPSSSAAASGLKVLPQNFSGIIHMQKPETMLLISPFNDPDTVWNLPLSANLFVRMYVPDDYEIPAPKTFKTPSVRAPMSLSSENQIPQHRAPTVPILSRSSQPMKINSFIDCHLSSFPVTAKIVDATQSPPFFRNILKEVDDVRVYRVEEAKRLFVKDAKSDTVFSLSHDLDVSFLEYPESFKTVLDLLHLPIGSEVKILEEIAADFPKPFSLRVGDIIKITTTNPQFIKMKHAPRDCEVLKCLKIGPEGGEPSKIKLPLDFEINMVLNIDRNSRKMISLQDLLAGSVPVPTLDVASIPSQSDVDLLKELPVDVRILKPMKETFLVVEPTKPFHLPYMPGRKLKQSMSFPSNGPKATDSQEASALGATAKHFNDSTGPSSSQRPQTNIGLPLSSGILLLYKDRLDIYELNVEASEADYVRIPVEKMTYVEFEERERLRKLNDDYEDVEFGSSSTIDETGSLKTLHLTRTGSTGLLERKDKMSKLDKVRRFSKALHPKHWRHSKAEPEPLPHPSAMGLMALAARPHEGQRNEYEQQHNSFSTDNKEMTAADSNDDDECHENLYEDVEIGPIKAATFAGPTARQTGAFSGASHMSLPLPRLPSRLLTSKNVSTKNRSQNVVPEPENGAGNSTRSEGMASKSQDYNPLTKARNWATNLSSKFSKNEGIRIRKERNDPDEAEKNLPSPPQIEFDTNIPSAAREFPSAHRNHQHGNDRHLHNRHSERPQRNKILPDKEPIVPSHISRPSVETNIKPFPSGSIDFTNEPAPKAPKRRKALLKAAMAQTEEAAKGNDAVSHDVMENVKDQLKSDIPSQSSLKENSESLNVDKISLLSNHVGEPNKPNHDINVGEPNKPNHDINGKIEPPRPKPRNLNKIVPENKISNIPILPPRGEAPPRKKAPDTLGMSELPEKPRPPPKPKVSQQSDV